MWARLSPLQNVSLFLSGGSSSLVFPLPHLLHSQSALSFALSVTLVYLSHSTPTLFALFFFHFSFIWVHIPLLLHSKFLLNDSKCLGPVPLQSCQHCHHIHMTTPTKSCTSACTVVLQDRVNKLNNHSKTHFVPNRFEVCSLIIDERWEIQMYSKRKNRHCFHFSLCLVDVLHWAAPLVTTVRPKILKGWLKVARSHLHSTSCEMSVNVWQLISDGYRKWWHLLPGN